MATSSMRSAVPGIINKFWARETPHIHAGSAGSLGSLDIRVAHRFLIGFLIPHSYTWRTFFHTYGIGPGDVGIVLVYIAADSLPVPATSPPNLEIGIALLLDAPAIIYLLWLVPNQNHISGTSIGTTIRKGCFKSHLYEILNRDFVEARTWMWTDSDSPKKLDSFLRRGWSSVPDRHLAMIASSTVEIWYQSGKGDIPVLRVSPAGSRAKSHYHSGVTLTGLQRSNVVLAGVSKVSTKIGTNL